MRHARSLLIGAVAAATVAALAVPTLAGEPDIDDVHRQLAARADLVAADTDRQSRPTSDGRTMQAANGCWTDPTGDPLPGPYDRADLVRYCADVTSTSVTLQHRNARPTSPTSDPNWMYGITGLLWSLDTNGDGEEEFNIYFTGQGGTIAVDVKNAATDTVLCQGTGSFDGTTYTAAVPMSCIGRPSRFWVDAFMAYDSQWDNPDAPVYGDLGAFRGPLAPATTSQPAPQPAPDGPADTGRLSGADRYATAVKISKHQFPDGANLVYIARGDSFPDALAGGSLDRGPVLLVPSCGRVPDVVLAEAGRLNPTKVIALGGTAAVCTQVLNDVAAAS